MMCGVHSRRGSGDGGRLDDGRVGTGAGSTFGARLFLARLLAPASAALAAPALFSACRRGIRVCCLRQRLLLRLLQGWMLHLQVHRMRRNGQLRCSQLPCLFRGMCAAKLRLR